MSEPPPLVLLHAFPFSSAMFAPQRAGLELAGVRLFALDQRGFAPGAGDPGAYTLDDVAADLARVRVPVLALVGEEDTLTPPSDAEAIARTASNARLRKIPRAGHLSNLEAPLAWNRAVLSFLLDVTG